MVLKRQPQNTYPKERSMKQDTLTIRSSAIPSHDEWAELARVYEYQDATRKFSSYDLLKFWIAAAIWRRVMEWISP